MRLRFSKDRVEVRVPRADELAFQGAAYVLTESAYVAIDASGRDRVVALWPKAGSGLKELAAEFETEYGNQLLRWKLLKSERKVLAAVLSKALAEPAAADRPAGAAPNGLPDERRAEIEAVLKEAQGETWDPLGIATPWEQLRGKGE